MRRHTPLYGFAFFLLFLLGSIFTVHTYAQSTGTITGKVIGDNSTPIPDVQVIAYYSFDSFFWNPVAYATTDGNGDYALSDLEPNTYRVGFFPQGYPREYFDGYYGNVTDVYSATDVIVTAGVTVPNINVQLSSGAHIKGRVTGPAGENVAGIQVSANGIDFGFYKAATTNANGRYDIGGLEAGTYSVGFRDPRDQPIYATEQFNNRGPDEQPSPVTVAKDQIRTSINAQLDRLGIIQGKVTDMAGDPIANITVVGQRYDAVPPYPSWYDDAYGYTDANGVYTMTGLYADTYRVMFQDNQYGTYSFEWYDNTYDPAAATLLTVTFNSTTTDINAQLDGRGTISGVVTDEQGHPLADITVRAEFLYDVDRQQWRSAGEAYTDSEGRYTLCCLNPQSYRITFWDSFNRYIYEYYDDVLDISVSGPQITLVSVTATQNTPNINARLSRYSTIDGTITDEANRPLSQVAVEFYRADSTEPQYDSTAYANENGYYNNSYLRPGLYRLRFYDVGPEQEYIEEYFENVPDLASATDISLSKEATVTVDAALAIRGRITGTVTDRTGSPIEGINIGLYQPIEGDSWYFVKSTTSDSAGNYRIGGLNDGTYVISFEDNRSERQFVNEYYDDTLIRENADPIVVAEGTLVANINAQLAALSTIEGNVTNESGEALQFIVVTPYRYVATEGGSSYWETAGYAETDESGNYRLSGLTAGTYRLIYQDYNGLYKNEWYDNRGYEDAATPIELAAETTLTGINAQLATEPYTWPPYAQNDAYSITEGGLLYATPPVLANDFAERCCTLQSTIVAQPSHGTVLLEPTGNFTYTHDGGESTGDHFTYRVNDGVAQSNIATVTITIQPVNDLPVAVDDSAQVQRGGTVTTLAGGATNVLANDSDAESTTLTATLQTAPQHGSVILQNNGTFAYTHNGDSATSDTFLYRAIDSFGAGDSATVHIAIQEVIEPTVLFSKTVSIEGIHPRCTTITEMKVPIDTTIVYCYTIHNQSNATLVTHSLVDSHLGQLLDGFSQVVAPGAAFSTTFTQTLTMTTTNVATWTATAGNVTEAVSDQSLQPEITTVQGAATIRISGPTDDADGDSIPDNLEKAGDIDGDNIPNYLDTDADGDGVDDRTEVGDNPAAPLDSDQDGIPDYLDRDSSPAANHQILLPIIQH